MRLEHRSTGLAERLRRTLRLGHASSQPEAPPAEARHPRLRGLSATAFSSPYVKIGTSLLLVPIISVGIWRLFFNKSAVAEGLEAFTYAYRLQRPTEARISGMGYAPMVSRRGVPDKVDYVARDRAERLLLDALSEDPSPASHHALGKFYLAERSLDKSVNQFDQALTQDPNNSPLHSDLGVALLELSAAASDQSNDPGRTLELLARSLEEVDKALRLNPGNVDALYNRGLVLLSMRLPEQAKASWQVYLSREVQPQWTAEAKHHLQLLLDADSAPATASEMLDSFMAAYQARDDEVAWQAASRNKEMIAGKFLPQQIAKAYLAESSQAEWGNAQRLLQALIYAGRLELERARDPFVSELAAYYARSGPAQRLLLSQAQARLMAGYDSCLQTRYKEALVPFIQAKALFIKARNEWEARICDYWIAYCYSQQDQIHESSALLSSLADYCEERSYQWLLGQATCWIAANHTELSEHSKSIESCHRALSIAEATADSYNEQKVLSQLGNEYIYLAQPARALEYNWRSLQLINRRFTSMRQVWRNYLFTARALIALDLYAAAAAYGNEMLTLALNNIKEPGVTHFSYLYLAQIHGGKQEFDEAIHLASESLKVGQSLPDAAASRKLSAGSLRLIGHFQRQAGNVAQALKIYDQAIRSYDQMELTMYKYDAHKGRLLCYEALNDTQNFEAQLPVVMDLFEQYRLKIQEEQNRNTFFDREQSVYDLAIDHAYTQGDYLRALDYSEKSLARSLLASLDKHARTSPAPQGAPSLTPSPPSLTLPQMQSQMPAKVQVVKFAVLADKVLIWVLTKDSFSSQKRDISSDYLRGRVSTYVKTMASGPGSAANLNEISRELFDLIIAPVAPLLDPEKVLCLVPDKALSYLPFAALISPSSGKYLISEFSLLSSPSLNVFLRCSERARGKSDKVSETLLSVGNPSFDPKSYPDLLDLPAAAREALGIAGNYSTAFTFIGPEALKDPIERRLADANIVHFACHYVANERYPMMSRLVLAKQDGSETLPGDVDLTAGELAGRSLPHVKLVILSACQTGGESYYNGEGLIGISRSFLETGIPLVVASQWAVESESTAELMLRFHRYRKLHSVSTVAALRRAQLEMIAEPNGFYRDPYYWAAFLPVGGYADF